MEVVGALASTLQIVSLCGEVTLTVIRWVESVRTIDERIDAFVQEVSTLRMTYETLSRSLRDPSMLEAARITNRDVGGHLWTQMSKTLHDCKTTVNNIVTILRKIQASNSILRPVIKQLKESLNSGELSRLREQVVMFNSSLQLPMQMMTLTLQLRHHEVTTTHQLQVNEQLALLRRGIERIQRMSKDLREPRRVDSLGGSTKVDTASDKGWFDNMEDYVGSAKRFLDSASVAASTLSASSINHRDEENNTMTNDARRGSAFVPLSRQKLQAINSFVEGTIIAGSAPESGTPLPSDAVSDIELQHEALYGIDDDDNEIDLQILQELLRNGAAELASQNYAMAEENYAEALSVSRNNTFDPQVACSSADIALLLGECLVKQEKYDDAIELLRPLATSGSSQADTANSGALSTFSSSQYDAEIGQILAANHMLGRMYLHKGQFADAEKCSLLAFKGRKKFLGPAHQKTIETVHLLIDTYRAKGQNARADAYRIFLKPSESLQPPDSGFVSSVESSPSPAGLSPVNPNVSSTKSKRPNFSFSSAFKRSSRTEAPPTSVPVEYSQHLTTSPHLVLDEFQQLSVSPNDTASLHRPLERRSSERKESSSSINLQWNVKGRVNSSDISGQQLTHQRTRSSVVCKAPTLYAAMSESEMERRFVEVTSLCNSGKTNKAIENAMSLLQQYDPDGTILVHRTAELKENIKRSKGKGLAGTGHGFSPIHFFCSLRYEAMAEINILLRLGADPDALAFKAGYGKLDPFVPLSLAVDRGHENLTIALLERGATWRSEAMRNGTRYNPDRDSVHPMIQACQKGCLNIVQILLSHNVELTEDLYPRLSWHGNSLLHEACFRCNLELVDMLMRYVRSQKSLRGNGSTYNFIGHPSQQDEFGMTPIMYAVDMRDFNETFLAQKSKDRITCLRLLLNIHDDEEPNPSFDDEKVTPSGFRHQDQHASSGDSNSPNQFASSLHIQDKKGNTVYWYAHETRGGDAALTAFLDEQSRRSRLIEF